MRKDELIKLLSKTTTWVCPMPDNFSDKDLIAELNKRGYTVKRPTTGAVDLGDSAALEVGQRSEVLSAGQGESQLAPNH